MSVEVFVNPVPAPPVTPYGVFNLAKECGEKKKEANRMKIIKGLRLLTICAPDRD